MTTDNPSPHTWEIVKPVLVTMTVPGTIDSDTWQRFIEDMKTPGVTKVFSLVRGAVTIDAIKRKDAAEAVKSAGLEVFVMTDHRLTRGILTAVSWLGANIRPFSWRDIDAALDRLDVNPSVRSRILKLATEFGSDDGE